MKLVEILARELKEWPHAATHAYSSGHLARFSNGGKTIHDYLDIGQEPEDYAHAHVSRAQWQEARDALNKPAVEAWSGHGIPPVGVEVEALLPALGSARYWQIAKVVHGPLKDSPNEILVFSLENTKPSWVDKFRPIPTPEQIAAEERDQAIQEMAGIARKVTGFGINIADMAALYDAGYRKQEPEPE